MFTDDSSENWNSNAFQDAFIEDYFGKKMVSKVKQQSKSTFDSSLSLQSVTSLRSKLKRQKRKRNEDILCSSINGTNDHILNYPPEKVKVKKTTINSSAQNDNIMQCEKNALLKKNNLSESVIANPNLLKKKKKKKLRNRDLQKPAPLNINANIPFKDNNLKAASTHTEERNDADKNLSTSLKKSMKHEGKVHNSSQINIIKSKKEVKLHSKDITESVIANSDSLKKKKKKLKLKNKDHLQIQKQYNSDDNDCYQENSKKEFSVHTNGETNVSSKDSSCKKSDLFQCKDYKKLQAAKFRYLNEVLYTNTGKDALKYFQENVEDFQDYHTGYQSQVSKWPLNPVDIIIKELHKMSKKSVIADLGCGEAKIAQVLFNRTVYSFDLIALKDCVTACDIANIPLPDKSVDVAVFCLSLMGTNWKDYLVEAYRILKLGGVLKVAEIESRIENLNDFIKNIECYGFSLFNKNVNHKMFIFLNFKKVKKNAKVPKVKNVNLKPCLYKKR